VTADLVVPGEDATITATVSGPGGLGLSYLLVDPSVGQVVASGDAEPSGAAGGEDAADAADAAEFTVTIPAEVTEALFPGSPYQLFLAASSDALARVTERRVDLEVAL